MRDHSTHAKGKQDGKKESERSKKFFWTRTKSCLRIPFQNINLHNTRSVSQ